MSEHGHDKPGPERDVDALLRDLSSHPTMPDDLRKGLKQELKHVLRYHHRRRAKSAVLGLATIVLVMGLGTEMYLGSDGFEFESRDCSSPDRVNAFAVIGKHGYTESKSLGSTAREVQDRAAAIREAQMSGDFKLEMMEAWTVRGKTDFIRTDQYIINGDTVSSCRAGEGRTMTDLQDYREFLGKYEDMITTNVPKGVYEMIGEETIEYADATVLYRKWRIPCGEWGDVIYWLGYPID